MAAALRTLLTLRLMLLIILIFKDVTAKKYKGNSCKFNGKVYKPGEVVFKVNDYCVELKCLKKGKQTVVAMEPIENCIFQDECKRLSPPGFWYPEQWCPYGSHFAKLVSPDDDICCQKSNETMPSTLTFSTTNRPNKRKIKGHSSTCPDCDWSKFGATHTMNLKPDPDCRPHKNEVTDADIATILAKHNTLRAKVANGEEPLGCSGPQPKAGNMLEMRWNCQLAKVAQAWADQCSDDHDKSDDRRICDPENYVGQNLYWAWNFEPASEWDAAIEDWFSEVKDMPSSLVRSFGDNTCGTGGVIGHYTQMVWAETYEVGCGAIHHKTKYQNIDWPEAKIYVCNYGPGGNWKGETVYKKGSAASACPNGASTKYPGLCATPP